MPESFEAYRYFSHLRHRWRVAATACLVAVVLSFLASLLLPKKYRSTARVLVQIPEGDNPQTALVVSPVYLDSLRTYEQFVSSDHLFQQAVSELGIRDGKNPQPLSSLKESILRVRMLPRTRVLEISVTLADPRKAQALAARLAADAVQLKQRENTESVRTGTDQFERLVTAAREHVEQAQQELLELARSQPVDGLAEEIHALTQARAFLRLDSLSGQARTPPTSADRLESLNAEIARKQELLAVRRTLQQAAQAEVDSAWEELNETRKNLNLAKLASPSRGERLQLLDPGVVPERPVFPNVPLNILAAFVLALVGSVVYLTLAFSFAIRKAESLRHSIRVASHG